MPLLTGGSGIALGLGRNFAAERKTADTTAVNVVGGPEAILAGSCSKATLGQIEYHATCHPVLPIGVEAAMSGQLTPDHVLAFLLAHQGQAPLAYSSDAPEKVRQLQDRYGREAIAAKLDGFFATIARHLVDNGIRRLVGAGGETSGAVVSALGLAALTIGPEIAPGVPVVTRARSLWLWALKSGNFGQNDFFERALAIMEGKRENGTRS